MRIQVYELLPGGELDLESPVALVYFDPNGVHLECQDASRERLLSRLFSENAQRLVAVASEEPGVLSDACQTASAGTLKAIEQILGTLESYSLGGRIVAEVVEFESVRGHTAGFLQLSDIAEATLAGKLSPEATRTLLVELHAYLTAEEGCFLAAESGHRRPDLSQGAGLVADGLGLLASVVEEALTSEDWSAPGWAARMREAVEADQEIRSGAELTEAPPGPETTSWPQL